MTSKCCRVLLVCFPPDSTMTQIAIRVLSTTQKLHKLYWFAGPDSTMIQIAMFVLSPNRKLHKLQWLVYPECNDDANWHICCTQFKSYRNCDVCLFPIKTIIIIYTGVLACSQGSFCFGVFWFTFLTSWFQNLDISVHMSQNRNAHRWRQTPCMKFPSACAPLSLLEPLSPAALFRKNNNNANPMLILHLKQGILI